MVETHKSKTMIIAGLFYVYNDDMWIENFEREQKHNRNERPKATKTEEEENRTNVHKIDAIFMKPNRDNDIAFVCICISLWSVYKQTNLLIWSHRVQICIDQHFHQCVR